MTDSLGEATGARTGLLAGGSSEWRALDDTEKMTEDQRAQIFATESFLRNELNLIVNAENLVVLAGLGTSIGLASGSGEKSAPKMSDLWAQVKNLESFEKVKDTLDPGLIEKSNLEFVLSDSKARVAINPDDVDLADFIAEAEDIVLSSCSFVDEETDVTNHEIFLRKVARRSTRLQRAQLFTTNYDLAFEIAAQRIHFKLIDGFAFGWDEFDSGAFDLDIVRRLPNEQPQLEPNVFHLLKLHGSVNWDSSNEGVKKVVGKPKHPVLIYPSAAKYRLTYQQPYLEFMSRFQIALRQPNVGLIIVGFGFNDEHLVAPIQAALRSNVGLRAIVVDPMARSETRATTFASIEDLIARGDRRLTMLKGTFNDLTRLLPDMPPLEDRDAHLERFTRRPGEGR